MLEETMGYRRTVEKLDELFAQYIYVGTMLTLADIHNSQDLTDDYWAEEYGACLSALTEIYETMENVFLGRTPSFFTSLKKLFLSISGRRNPTAPGAAARVRRDCSPWM